MKTNIDWKIASRRILALLTVAAAAASAAGVVRVQAVMSQGTALAETGSGQAFLLVEVNDPATGAAVTGLPLQVSDQMSLPGQACGFTNQIAGFAETGDGAYEIKIGLPEGVPNCAWIKGVYLAGVHVTGNGEGRTIASLTIR
ncbi:exported hypothetical protein [Candidatus Sulfopaludibacter sp. SbA4]|nr:exported hypothetical protein [Candidatus Sulfopaludibacter sp. SbA4]